MKKTNALVLAALLTLATITGCRSKTNDNKTPSTTTVPTTMPTTAATTNATDPTVASGNGPIDETGMTTSPETIGTTGAAQENETNSGTGTT